MEKRMLLISSSKSMHGAYLAHAYDPIRELLASVQQVCFVPFARPGGMSHDAYTAAAAEGLKVLGKDVVGVHTYDDPVRGVQEAEAVFIGGGNTFLLLRGLYETGLIEAIRDRVQAGMPYMGTSAGSNVAGRSICTTNDMPIVYPPSFDAMNLVPFNINPHFPRVEKDPHHMGESREDRIHEFHFQSTTPVVAIREDSMLRVQGNSLQHMGESPGLLFQPGKADAEIPAGSDLSYLLQSAS